MFSARAFSQQQYKDLPRFVRQALTVFGQVEKRNERERKKILHHAEQQLEQTQQNNITQQSIVHEQRRTVRLLDQLIQAVRSKRSGSSGPSLPGFNLNSNHRQPGKIRRFASRVGSTLLGGAAAVGSLLGVATLANPGNVEELFNRAITPLAPPQAIGGDDLVEQLRVIQQAIQAAPPPPPPPTPASEPTPQPVPPQQTSAIQPTSSQEFVAEGSQPPQRSTSPQLVQASAATPGAALASQSAQTQFHDRILRFRARQIEFKADSVTFGNETQGTSGPTAGPSSSGQLSRPAVTGNTNATPGGLDPAVQQVIQRVQVDFPDVEITSGVRPHSHGSQHQTGRAVDLSLRRLPESQRAQLVENLTAGRYGGVGGLGMYNAQGDTLHIDVRSGQRQAWGPNHSRTSLHQTPLWFQSAVQPWQQGQSSTQAVATAPSSGAAIHEHSQQDAIATAQPTAPSITVQTQSEAGSPGSFGAGSAPIDPDDPGPVEPADAATRYARLFGLDLQLAA